MYPEVCHVKNVDLYKYFHVVLKPDYLNINIVGIMLCNFEDYGCKNFVLDYLVNYGHM